jgi:hypothetical protein
MSSFTFICWVFECPLQIFSVSIEIGKDVHDLKEEIKKEMKIDGPACYLRLWKVSNMFKCELLPMANLRKVSIPYGENLNDNLIKDMLRDAKQLLPTSELSSVFSNPLPRQHIHILARCE